MPEQLPPLLPPDEACRRILALARPVAELEEVELLDALGRVSATDLHATVDVPPRDDSAMDGIAVNTRDPETRRLVEAGKALPVSQRLPAGGMSAPLAPGTAARIFTGGEMPEGADAIVIQEDCRFLDGSVEVLAWPEQGQYVRPAGQDLKRGERIFPRGTRFFSEDLGLLASAGIAAVQVFRRVRVALLATGDELQHPGRSLAAGQRYNSGTHTLSALLRELGCEVRDCGLVPDTRAATRAALRRAEAEADVILTIGGVSVGEEDHVRACMKELGRLDVWRIAIRPGKPLAVGRLGEVPVLGLPGNPVSSFVTFLLFARPFLLRTQGRTETAPCVIRLPAAEPLAAGARREYQRVRIADGRVVPYANQGSGVLSSVVWADALALVPPDTTIQPGQQVEVLLLNALRH